MRPDEVKFDRLQVWVRVLNLPYNLRDDAWCLPIARTIDKEVQIAKFDHNGGYLRARVSVDVNKPLRRWVLIDSARRKKVDHYDMQYEQIPYFCFSCGRLGHSDLYCSNPGSRDDESCHLGHHCELQTRLDIQQAARTPLGDRSMIREANKRQETLEQNLSKMGGRR